MTRRAYYEKRRERGAHPGSLWEELQAREYERVRQRLTDAMSLGVGRTALLPSLEEWREYLPLELTPDLQTDANETGALLYADKALLSTRGKPRLNRLGRFLLQKQPAANEPDSFGRPLNFRFDSLRIGEGRRNAADAVSHPVYATASLRPGQPLRDEIIYIREDLLNDQTAPDSVSLQLGTIESAGPLDAVVDRSIPVELWVELQPFGVVRSC
jgi:hypothetical protein